MSGPITTMDVLPSAEVPDPQSGPIFELYQPRETAIGKTLVRRTLPKRQRRTIGAWCFADHFGPERTGLAMEVGPHPHIGLHTATWLLAGELLHRDSLGSEQLIRPGELNLMTAGSGVTHSEEASPNEVPVHNGIQLWIAQPDRTRNEAPAFEHHDALPEANFDNATATVFLGSFGGVTSSARADTPIVGVEATLGIGSSVLELRKEFEYGIIVLEGRLAFKGSPIEQDALAYFGTGREELMLTAQEPCIFLLLGGEPFAETPLMWWNFVARTRAEIDQAYQDWQERSPRFGSLDSKLDRIDAPKPDWR